MITDVALGFLLFFGTIIVVPIVFLCVHSINYNKWNDNFSKKGLENHTKDYFIGFGIGACIIGAASVIKSIFKSK